MLRSPKCVPPGCEWGLLSVREGNGGQLPRVLQPASSFCFDLSALLPPHPFIGHWGGGAPVWSSKGDTVYILLVFDPKGELFTLPPEVSPLGDNLDFMLEGVSFSPWVLSTPLALKLSLPEISWTHEKEETGRWDASASRKVDKSCLVVKTFFVLSTLKHWQHQLKD